MKKQKFCVVIPVYKKELDCTEELSLNRLVKVISKKDYPIYLICPKSLDTNNYYKILNKEKTKEIRFNDKYFEDTKGYSQLCLSYDFYNKFSKYEFMYIYQLDCYLFEDQLEDWCKFNYDYIGAPILATSAGWNTYDEKTKQWGPKVGNGGFSLRKIDIFKELTDPNGEFRTYYKLNDEIISKVVYEDKYFCNDIYNFYDLNTPNWILASKFSWDMNVDVYKKLTNQEYIPMGCHAWPKNIRYWKNIFEDITPEIIDFCENKYKEYFKLYYKE